MAGSRATVQSPRGYDQTNTSGNSLTRTSLRARLQDVFYNFARTPGEVAAGASATALRWGYKPGHLERFKANASPGVTDFVDELRLAMEAADAKFPTVYFDDVIGISEAVVFEEEYQQGLALRGSSRVVAILSPLEADLTGPDGINAMFINKKGNGHILWEELRFNDEAAFTGKILYCKEGGGTQAAFSMRAINCWFGLSANNSGHIYGTLSNYYEIGSVIEGLKTAHLFLTGAGNGDIVLDNITGNFGYDSLIMQDSDDNHVAVLRVTNVHWYQWLRGRVIELLKARSVQVSNVTIELHPDEVGDGGLLKWRNVIDAEFTALKMVYSNSGERGTNSVGLEFDGCRVKGSHSRIQAHTGMRLAATQINISGASKAAAAVFTASAAHRLQTTQKVTHLNLPGDFGTALNGVSIPVTVLTATTYSVPVNSTGFADYTSGGTVQADLEIELNDVDFTGCEYGMAVATGSPRPYGTLITRGCKFNEMQQYGLVHLAASGFNWYSYDDEFLDAGMDGVASGRNLDLNNSGEIVLYRPRIGRRASRAAAGYFLLAAGTGTLRLVEPEWVGAAPIGRIDSSSTQTVQRDETGTWSPSLGGSATYTTQQGFYQVRGKVCHVWGRITVNAIGSGSATTITGLPFTSHATIPGAGNCPRFSGANANVTTLGLYIAPNGTSMVLHSLTAAGVATATNGIMTSGTDLPFYASYPLP